MQAATRLVTLAAALTLSPACLVLTLNPAYDDNALGWDPALVGSWQNTDDKSSMQIDRGEWKSYKVHYVHPIETGHLTAYLTTIGERRYLDLMPARGEDRGSFLIPAHVVVAVALEGDRLELTPLSYDWFFDLMREGRGVERLLVALDQKENALIASPTAVFRDWLRLQPADGPMFGAPAVFTKK